MDASVRIIVEGLVQGVGYRWFVARRAEALGVRGSARNLYDGSVEVQAAGDRAVLEELIRELRVGPRSAQVRNLKIEWGPPGDNPDSHFEIE